MAFGNKEIMYSVDENFDFIIEEKGNQFLALRKLAWGRF